MPEAVGEALTKILPYAPKGGIQPGGVLGGVFNQLATDLTETLPWFIRWLPMLLILLLGHGINFGLCMISSFVHPMRLTFVEFFKNANFEGGGKAFTPFRRKAA